ncbi:MAG: replicative DNA helicase [Candidatus Hydrogenedens sp.]|nr:replicative DNA helicase [Candidatus Hydrogenedentota bacterium]NLF57616.1 replicative DNA helicase [Candidatus Hydrogenedens sp.]
MKEPKGNKKGPPAGGPVFDRTPPSSIEAERSVLGSIIINPAAIGQALEILQENETDTFYVPAHQMIYDAAVAIFRRNFPVDLVTLSEELNRLGQLDAVGGAAYLADLAGASPTSANIEYYAQIVLDTALLRRLIVTCGGISATAYEQADTTDEILDQAEADIFRLNERRQANPIHPISRLVDDGVARIEKKIKDKTSINGVPTGFMELDKLLSGLQPSDMIVLAARPSVGKTAFALNIAANAATHEGKSVLIFSLEMAKEQLVQRLLCSVGQIDMNRLRDGFLAEAEFPKVQRAAGILAGAKIFIDESSGLTPLELRSKARRLDTQQKLDLIIIDYMQLMHVSGRAESRQTEISAISRAIKGIARELHVPVITLSQLSREADKDEDGSPKLSHLRESGAIEQDADVVMILSRPPKKDREGRENVILLNIAKQRNGPTGQVELLFRRSVQRFMSVDDKGVPGAAPPPGAVRRVPEAGLDMDEPVYDESAFEEDDAPF